MRSGGHTPRAPSPPLAPPLLPEPAASASHCGDHVSRWRSAQTDAALVADRGGGGLRHCSRGQPVQDDSLECTSSGARWGGGQRTVPATCSAALSAPPARAALRRCPTPSTPPPTPRQVLRAAQHVSGGPYAAAAAAAGWSVAAAGCYTVPAYPTRGVRAAPRAAPGRTPHAHARSSKRHVAAPRLHVAGTAPAAAAQ